MRLRNFLRRSRLEQRLLAEALCWVTFTRVALWVLPFRILRPLVERLGRASTLRVADDSVAARVAWAVATAAGLVPRANCVPQAMAARILMARRGLASEICYGVGRANGRIVAHAWLESDGRVIVGSENLELVMPLAPLERRLRERRILAQSAAANT